MVALVSGSVSAGMILSEHLVHMLANSAALRTGPFSHVGLTVCLTKSSSAMPRPWTMKKSAYSRSSLLLRESSIAAWSHSLWPCATLAHGATVVCTCWSAASAPCGYLM
jgi:hypothetical protein